MHQTAKAAHRVKGAYWHFFPTLAQGRRSIWEGYRRDGKRTMENVFPGFLNPKAPGSIVRRKDEGEMLVELKCGSIWRLMGTDKVESVGAGPKGVVFSEFALCRPSSWDFVRPMLRETDGWAWFITTPRGPNHAKTLWDDAGSGSGWYRDLQTVHDTGLMYASNRRPGAELTATEMMDEERAEGMEEALIRQEYLCDWAAAFVGSIWGDLLEAMERDGRVGHFEAEDAEVFTTWDLGRTDNTSCWFWRLNRSSGGIDVVDHHRAHGKGLDYYFRMLREKSGARGYSYRRHWLPHDAAHTTLAAGTSVLSQFIEEWGKDHVALGPSASIVDGIQAGRRLLSHPTTRIHARCAEGLTALKAYRYEYDEERRVFARKPLHDWASDDGDAFRYLANVVVAADLLTRDAPKAEPKPDPMSIDELFKRHMEAAERRRAW